MSREQYQIEADGLIASRIAELRGLTFNQARALPEAAGDDTLIAGRKCAVTTYRQQMTSAEVLVTVQVARRTALGLGSVHTERASYSARAAQSARHRGKSCWRLAGNQVLPNRPFERAGMNPRLESNLASASRSTPLR